MHLNRYGKSALALLCSGALFAVGFAIGSGGQREPPGPKRASAPPAGATAIGSLWRAQSIPSLRAFKSRGGGSATTSVSPAPSTPGGASTAGGTSTTPATGPTVKPKPKPQQSATF